MDSPDVAALSKAHLRGQIVGLRMALEIFGYNATEPNCLGEIAIGNRIDELEALLEESK